MPGRPWKISIHMRAEIDAGDDKREYLTIHRVSRDTDGRWSIRVERPGHAPTEVSGEGDLPAIVEADGAIVILLPQPGQAIAYPPTAP